MKRAADAVDEHARHFELTEHVRKVASDGKGAAVRDQVHALRARRELERLLEQSREPLVPTQPRQARELGVDELVQERAGAGAARVSCVASGERLQALSVVG